MKTFFLVLFMALAIQIQAQKTVIGGLSLETGAKTATLKLSSGEKKVNGGKIDYYYLSDKANNLTITEAKYDAKNKIEYVAIYKANIADLEAGEYSSSQDQNVGSYFSPKYFKIVANGRFKSFSYQADTNGKLQDPTEELSEQQAFIFNTQKKADEWVKFLNKNLNK